MSKSMSMIKSMKLRSENVLGNEDFDGLQCRGTEIEAEKWGRRKIGMWNFFPYSSFPFAPLR